ncbi:MAG TPA: glycosyltransferase family 2 protein [Candidatus Aquabacterium excrementipullorum]|nr:glycosyltransferase family 2 protein [Candidatus Aquabacterium excrementipullorum]
MNVLILAAGPERAEDHADSYPLCLAELDGQPLIERIIGALDALSPSRFIFCFRKSDVRQFHLADITSLLAPGSKVMPVSERTGGAACTALLGAEFIDNDEELLIVNGNELLEIDFSVVVNGFRQGDWDAGVVTFPSIHPRYSYVRLDEHGLVVEAAEKRPISRFATAGFYWFRRGADFVQSAKSMIRKDASVNGSFYICPSLNELILQQRRIGTHGIEAAQYKPLKTAKQVEQFETSLGKDY